MDHNLLTLCHIDKVLYIIGTRGRHSKQTLLIWLTENHAAFEGLISLLVVTKSSWSIKLQTGLHARYGAFILFGF